MFGVGIVKELGIGLCVVAHQNAFEGLGAEGGAFSCIDTLDVGRAEEGDELAVVGKETVGLEEGGGNCFVGEIDWEVVGDLDGVVEGEVPEGRGKEVFSEEISGHIDQVFPIAFCEAVLVLTMGWGATDLGRGREGGGGRVELLEKLKCFPSNEFEVAISDHLLGELT